MARLCAHRLLALTLLLLLPGSGSALAHLRNQRQARLHQTLQSLSSSSAAAAPLPFVPPAPVAVSDADKKGDDYNPCEDVIMKEYNHAKQQLVGAGAAHPGGQRLVSMIQHCSYARQGASKSDVQSTCRTKTNNMTPMQYAKPEGGTAPSFKEAYPKLGEVLSGKPFTCAYKKDVSSFKATGLRSCKDMHKCRLEGGPQLPQSSKQYDLNDGPTIENAAGSACATVPMWDSVDGKRYFCSWTNSKDAWRAKNRVAANCEKAEVSVSNAVKFCEQSVLFQKRTANMDKTLWDMSKSAGYWSFKGLMIGLNLAAGVAGLSADGTGHALENTFLGDWSAGMKNTLGAMLEALNFNEANFLGDPPADVLSRPTEPPAEGTEERRLWDEEQASEAEAAATEALRNDLGDDRLAVFLAVFEQMVDAYASCADQKRANLAPGAASRTATSEDVLDQTMRRVTDSPNAEDLKAFADAEGLITDAYGKDECYPMAPWCIEAELAERKKTQGSLPANCALPVTPGAPPATLKTLKQKEAYAKLVAHLQNQQYKSSRRNMRTRMRALVMDPDFIFSVGDNTAKFLGNALLTAGVVTSFNLATGGFGPLILFGLNLIGRGMNGWCDYKLQKIKDVSVCLDDFVQDDFTQGTQVAQPAKGKCQKGAKQPCDNDTACGSDGPCEGAESLIDWLQKQNSVSAQLATDVLNKHNNNVKYAKRYRRCKQMAEFLKAPASQLVSAITTAIAAAFTEEKTCTHDENTPDANGNPFTTYQFRGMRYKSVTEDARLDAATFRRDIHVRFKAADEVKQMAKHCLLKGSFTDSAGSQYLCKVKYTFSRGGSRKNRIWLGPKCVPTDLVKFEAAAKTKCAFTAAEQTAIDHEFQQTGALAKQTKAVETCQGRNTEMLQGQHAAGTSSGKVYKCRYRAPRHADSLRSCPHRRDCCSPWATFPAEKAKCETLPEATKDPTLCDQMFAPTESIEVTHSGCLPVLVAEAGSQADLETKRYQFDPDQQSLWFTPKQAE